MDRENEPPAGKAGNGAGILARGEGATIAYDALAGKNPGVVFLHGFMSDRSGDKALALEAHCAARGHAFVRFDTMGHGTSSGRFEDGTIGRWAEDAVAVLEHLTRGPQILVGSSMGGWLALLAALARPDRVAGILGLAAAPDFTEDLMWRDFTEAERATLLRDGRVEIASCYGPQNYVITRDLVEDGRRHLLLKHRIPLHCPVRLIHGQKDMSVPWRTALTLADKLDSQDVEVTLVKDGMHRLSDPHDMARMLAVLDGLLARVAL